MDAKEQKSVPVNSPNASAFVSDGHQAFDNSTARDRARPALNLAAVRAKLWNGKAKILAIACAAALLAAVYSVLNPPRYEASTRILIDPRAAQVAASAPASGYSGSAANLSVIESQIQVILSDGVLARVVKTESLALDSEFGVKVGPLAMLFGSGSENKVAPEQRALRLLADALEVTRVPGSYVVDVSVSTRNPQKSARIAQAVASTYVSTELEAKASEAGKAASSFSTRLDDLRGELKAAEGLVEKFKADNKLVDAAGRLVSDRQLSQLSAELAAARTRAAQSRSKFEQIERFQRAGTSLDTLADAIQSEIITQLRVRLASLRARMVARQSVLHQDNPELKQMRDQAASLGRQINVELERIASSSKSEAVRLQTNVLDLERELQKRTGDSVKTNKSLVRLRELERDVEAKKAVYEALLAKAGDLGAGRSNERANIRIVSAASVPGTPEGLPLPAMLLLGFGAGLVAGSAYVLARPSGPVAQSVWPQPAGTPEPPAAPGGIAQRMAEHSASVFPAPPPAVPPAPPPASSVAPAPEQAPTAGPALRPLGTVSGLSDPTGLYPFVTSEPLSLATAAIGQLNRLLRTTRRRGVPQTVLVGACGTVEARPGIAMNLALSAAGGGDRVLLIDAALLERELSKTLAASAVIGIGEIAGGIITPGDIMIKHPNLTVAFMPAAESRLGPPPVLAEQGLRDHVLRAVKGFDLIIFDGGQLEDNPSTPALGAVAHDIVLVTDQNHAPALSLQSTLEQLAMNQTKVRGTLSVA